MVGQVCVAGPNGCDNLNWLESYFINSKCALTGVTHLPPYELWTPNQNMARIARDATQK
jgi:hypothetical protein